MRRHFAMCGGILIMGLGVALSKLSLMGNDPTSAMVMAINEHVGVDFSILMIAANSLMFLLELCFGRNLVGAGTFVNWLGVGPLTTLYSGWITAHWDIPQEVVPRLLLMAAGVLLLSLSASLYQTAGLGVSPYDSLSIMLTARFSIPYFWCRIFTDSICTAVTFVLGGILGPGTLISALGLGPFISFFDRYISHKVCGVQKGQTQARG